MFEDDHENLFSSFGAAPTMAVESPASAPRSPAVPPELDGASTGGAEPALRAASPPSSGLPLPSSLPASMVNECILSVQWRNISAVDRHAIEAQLRTLRVPALASGSASEGEAVGPAAEEREAARGGAAPPAAGGAVPEPAAPSAAPNFGSVHYCQAYCVDWQGEASASDAAALPAPRYSLLLSTPLPLPPRLPACSPSACFNCGKEGHQSRSCPRPKAAVPLFAAPVRTGPRKAPAFQGRYFDPEPVSGSMVPGLLSAELQAMLGMRPLDPPPYLPRMHKIGFPPGYIGSPPATGHDATAPAGHLSVGPSSGGARGAAGDSGAADAKVDTAALEMDQALEMDPADLVLKLYREAPGAPPGGAAAPARGVAGGVASALSLAAPTPLPFRTGGQATTAGAITEEGRGRPPPAAGAGTRGTQAVAAVPLVQLPGLNAAPPQGTDWRRWGWRPDQPVTKVARIWR